MQKEAVFREDFCGFFSNNAGCTQGWPFALSLLCYQSLFLKSDHEQFALVALYKRANLSELLLSVFKKEQQKLFARVGSFALKKRAIRPK